MRFGIGRAAFAGLITAAGMALPASAGAVTQSYDFSTGDQGWSLYNQSGCGGTFSTAGHDAGEGGYLVGSDNEATEQCAFQFAFPIGVDGELRSNYGGTVEFDVRYPGAGADVVPAVVFFRDDPTDALAPELLVGSTGAIPAEDIWTQYSLDIRAGAEGQAWDYVGPSAPEGRPATLADFRTVLSDVYFVSVSGDLDRDAGGDALHLDDVSIADPASAPDADGDGIGDMQDDCPEQAGVADGAGCPAGVPPPPANDGDCERAKEKLAKAKRKLRKLRQKDAAAKKIAKAKKKVRRAKQAKREACA